jgi:hypothetical protein
MTAPRDPQPGTPPAKNFVTRREAVDAYFDGELSRRSSLVRDAIRDIPGDQQRLEQTERILDELTAPIHAPDLTLSILDDVHMLRPFQPPSPPLWRTVASWSAIAASIVLAIGGYVVVQSFGAKNPPIRSTTGNSDIVAAAPATSASVRSALDAPSNSAARRNQRTLDLGPVAADVQPRRWDTQLDRTGLDEVPLATLEPQPQRSALAGALARDLGLAMKPSVHAGLGSDFSATNLSYRREPFPVPPSAWLRRPVKGPPLFDLSKTAEPAASAWFAPRQQRPLSPR